MSIYISHKQKNIYILLEGVWVPGFSFKQLPLNTKQKCESSYYLIDGEILLSVVVKLVSFPSDKILDFHDTTFSVLPSLFKV